MAAASVVFAHDIPSAVSREECERLGALAEGKTVLEVGSEFGRSTIALAGAAAVVHSVDWHHGDVGSGFKDSLPEFWKNLGAYGMREKVIVHIGRWEDVAGVLRWQYFDMAFIDGDHQQEAVVRDLALVAAAIRPGALVVMHDADQPQVHDAGSPPPVARTEPTSLIPNQGQAAMANCSSAIVFPLVLRASGTSARIPRFGDPVETVRPPVGTLHPRYPAPPGPTSPSPAAWNPALTAPGRTASRSRDR